MVEKIVMPAPSEEVACPHCMGTGKVWGVECPLCQGYKTVPKEVAQRAAEVAARRARGEKSPRPPRYDYKKRD
ncbi:MAG: hypothetical protein JXA21_01760 [Anaerolineae bacterium]|nr:hypothetical protein [Anaerolineae bacterium]